MCILSGPTLRVLSKQNALPDDVLLSILEVYEFGKMSEVEKIPIIRNVEDHNIREDLKYKENKVMPNNLICQFNGNFWTTWDKVMEIREYLKAKKKEKNSNLN